MYFWDFKGKGQRRTKALHIVDAIILGEEDIRSLPYKERLDFVINFILFSSFRVNKKQFILLSLINLEESVM